MTRQRNRQTREQRRREALKTAGMVGMLIALWAVLTVWALGVWAEHPAEQPISGRVYVATMAAE